MRGLKTQRTNPEPWDSLSLQLMSLIISPMGTNELQDFAVSCADAGVTPIWVEEAFKAKPSDVGPLTCIWSPYVDFFLASDALTELFEAASDFDIDPSYTEIPIKPKEADKDEFFLLWIPRDMFLGNGFFPPEGTNINRSQFTRLSKPGNKLWVVHDSDQQVPVYDGNMNVTKKWKGVFVRHLDRAAEKLHRYYIGLRLQIWLNQLPKLTYRALGRLTMRGCREYLPSTTFNEMRRKDIVAWSELLSELLRTDQSEHPKILTDMFPQCRDQILRGYDD